jgi:inorganic pyrophosphatase
MKPDLTPFLGQPVGVIIDRPLGSRHPRHPDLVYPLNYGFLPGTTSGDGMPVDAYPLGVDEAVNRAEGVIIAVVVRADGVEDKLAVAPAGELHTADQIMAQVRFQERFFDGSIVAAEAHLNE